MEKKIIILILAPILMFFNWFDPVVKENERGEKAYKNKKYEEALKHFQTAKSILSQTDNHKDKINNAIAKLESTANYIKSINGDTLSLSELKKRYKQTLISNFATLSKDLQNLKQTINNSAKTLKNKENNVVSKNIINNLNSLIKKIKIIVNKNGDANIGSIYRSIVYTKSQLGFYNSKIEESNQKPTPDLDALRYNIASTYYELKNYDSAINEFKKINPDKSNIKRSELLYDLGNTHFMKKNYKTAVELYKKSLREDPKDMEARQNYELALKMLKKQEQKKKQEKNKKKDEQKKKKQNKDNKQNKKDKNKKEQDKNKKKEKQKKKQQDKNKKQDKAKKDKDKDKKQDKKDKSKQEQDKKKSKQKPENKHKNMLRFLNQNEKKLMKKMLKKNKLLKYGIKKTKKKGKDW